MALYRFNAEFREMSIKIDGREVEVIDVHVHSPRVTVPGRTREAVIDDFIKTMNTGGVDRAVLLAIETDSEDIAEHLLDENLDIEETARYFWYFWREVALKSRHTKPYLRDLGRQILEVVKTPDEEVKLFTDRHPDRFTGFGSVDPKKKLEYIGEKLEKIKRYGFKGIKLLPTLQFFNPGDSKLEPIYEFAEKNSLTILMHMGCNFGPWNLPSLAADARPMYLKKVAEEYPDLKLICAHLGGHAPFLPGRWLDEAIELASNSDNIYLDISAIYVEELIQKAIAEIGADKLLFGSDYPAITGFCDHHTGLKNCVRWFASLEIPFTAKQKIFGENARKLLELV